jgi:hypothetical protein
MCPTKQSHRICGTDTNKQILHKELFAPCNGADDSLEHKEEEKNNFVGETASRVLEAQSQT